MVTFSVVIPCHGKHIPLLPRALESIENQVVPPLEVLISASDLKSFAQHAPLLDELEQKDKFKFPVRIFRHSHKMHPGQNRQYAATRATGDVIVGHDADDVMHLQKIKLLDQAFRLYNPPVVLHNFRTVQAEPNAAWWARYNGDPPLSLKTKKPIWLKNLVDVGIGSGAVATPDVTFTHGHVVYKRKVLKAAAWGAERTSEDKAFLLKLWKKYHEILYIPLPLSVYRQFHSTTRSTKKTTGQGK